MAVLSMQSGSMLIDRNKDSGVISALVQRQLGSTLNRSIRGSVGKEAAGRGASDSRILALLRLPKLEILHSFFDKARRFAATFRRYFPDRLIGMPTKVGQAVGWSADARRRLGGDLSSRENIIMITMSLRRSCRRSEKQFDFAATQFIFSAVIRFSTRQSADYWLR
ncbi:unnamed protein product [Bursaphelenchus xylophilus]|uniref:(pine wood nematode) hypothetical protein n=1 Tax=Bursaphelenchus xylophilus TaxID=6326 RepID=A0A1I7SCQ1_BURXY|nr:unnamed protein product [Bursaphelenchus xylophilus]CAG9093703.1 unnamed protein product [Bursaphelenchus xylophilus]